MESDIVENSDAVGIDVSTIAKEAVELAVRGSTPPVEAGDTAAQPQPVPDVQAQPTEPEKPDPEYLSGLVSELQSRIENAHKEAQLHKLRLQEFSERLQTPEGQRRILLGLALSNPDLFESTSRTVERIKTDPEYAEAIREAVEAQIKLENTTREQKAVETAQAMSKGQIVESYTVKVAERLGLDPGVAKEQIVAKILINEKTSGKRDITLSEVEQTLTQFAKRISAKPSPKPAVKAPETQVAERSAPTTPVVPPSTPAVSQPQASSTKPASIQDAVRDAFSRIRQAGL